MDVFGELTALRGVVMRDALVRRALKNVEIRDRLMEVCLSGKEPEAWRAAWVLSACDVRQQGFMEDQVSRIIPLLPGLKSAGTLRSFLDILSRYEIPEEQQGMLVDLCFELLASGRVAVGIKAYAMNILFKHVLLYPELKTEFINIIEDLYNESSAGFKARARILIAQLDKIQAKE